MAEILVPLAKIKMRGDSGGDGSYASIMADYFGSMVRQVYSTPKLSYEQKQTQIKTYFETLKEQKTSGGEPLFAGNEITLLNDIQGSCEAYFGMRVANNPVAEDEFKHSMEDSLRNFERDNPKEGIEEFLKTLRETNERMVLEHEKDIAKGRGTGGESAVESKRAIEIAPPRDSATALAEDNVSKMNEEAKPENPLPPPVPKLDEEDQEMVLPTGLAGAIAISAFGPFLFVTGLGFIMYPAAAFGMHTLPFLIGKLPIKDYKDEVMPNDSVEALPDDETEALSDDETKALSNDDTNVLANDDVDVLNDEGVGDYARKKGGHKFDSSFKKRSNTDFASKKAAGAGIDSSLKKGAGIDSSLKKGAGIDSSSKKAVGAGIDSSLKKAAGAGIDSSSKKDANAGIDSSSKKAAGAGVDSSSKKAAGAGVDSSSKKAAGAGVDSSSKKGGGLDSSKKKYQELVDMEEAYREALNLFGEENFILLEGTSEEVAARLAEIPDEEMPTILRQFNTINELSQVLLGEALLHEIENNPEQEEYIIQNLMTEEMREEIGDLHGEELVAFFRESEEGRKIFNQLRNNVYDQQIGCTRDFLTDIPDNPTHIQAETARKSIENIRKVQCETKENLEKTLEKVAIVRETKKTNPLPEESEPRHFSDPAVARHTFVKSVRGVMSDARKLSSPFKVAVTQPGTTYKPKGTHESTPALNFFD